MNYYISDLHLNHSNIIGFNQANHLFANIEEMNQTIISNWNSIVKQNDTVYILGDFNWGIGKNWLEDIKKLKGKKILISGNHDLKTFPSSLKEKFTQIVDYLEVVEYVNDKKYRLILSHYPFLAFNKDYLDTVIHLYGHVHQYTEEAKIVREYIKILRNKKRTDPHLYINKGNMINVGACCPWINYTPRTLEYLLEVMEKNIDLI